MLDWKLGDKLVAVKEDGTGHELPVLVIGRVYTIKDIGLVHRAGACCDSEVGVGLEEGYSPTHAYCSCAFRKPIDWKDWLKVEKKELINA